MNQQRGFTLLEMMLVLALVAITASVVLFTYGREDVASTRARETAARFTAALELAIDRATLSGQPVGIHFSLLMANAGTGEPLLTLVCSGSWPLDQTLARDTRP